MIEMATLLEHLQEQGYDPDPAIDWYELVASGIGSVRACRNYPDVGYTDVYVFDGGMICEWEVHFSPGAPDAAIIAALEAAEWQLARRRGGPVTPAQVAAKAAREPLRYRCDEHGMAGLSDPCPLPHPAFHVGMRAHDGYAAHSHEVRPDHLGVERDA